MPDSAPYQAPPKGWRTFLIVWITQSISVIGSALTFFAITIWLTVTLYPTEAQKPQLAWALSALSLSFAVPTVFLAPIAGAFVDRHDRKRTMIAMDVANGFLTLAILLLIAAHRLNIVELIVIGALSASFGTFHSAAFDTSYAMIVPEEKLPRANGMMQTIFSLSGIVAPGLAAALISLPALARQGNLPGFASPLGQIGDGAVLAIGIDSATFFLAAITPLFLFIPSPKRTDLLTETGEKKSLWADVKEGALYIWHRRSFLWLLGTFTVANFTSGALVLQPIIVKFQIAPDWTARGLTLEAALALLATIGSLGGVAGGFFISAWGGLKRRRVYGVLVALIVSGLAQITYGASRWLFVSAAAAFLMEGMIPVMNSHSQTIWQTQTPRELQGRVFSVRRLIAQFSWPASTLLMGGLASRFDPGLIIVTVGSILTIWCAIGLFNPYLMRVEDKEWIEAQALKNAGVAAD
ncbi:MAG: MFS transporter [Chloroflexi bacterium]|nr:MFS transporter [Chloroflexota bacterium]